MTNFDEGYSPLWSPGDPVEPPAEILTESEQIALYRASKDAAEDWTAEDEENFWDAVPGGKPASA